MRNEDKIKLVTVVNCNGQIDEMDFKTFDQWCEERAKIRSQIYPEVIMQGATSEFERHLVRYLEEGFEEVEYPNGFYDYVEITYDLLDEGELGLDFIFQTPAEEIMQAFEAIGVIYPDEQSYLEAKEAGNEFQGKFYCCYFDSETRRPYFFRDEDGIDAEIEYRVYKSYQPDEMEVAV